MGHRLPLAPNATELDRLVHRQTMAGFARIIDPERAILAGFRPQYMERVLVAMGHADPKLLAPDRSERSKRRHADRAKFRKRFKETNGGGFYGRW